MLWILLRLKRLAMLLDSVVRGVEFQINGLRGKLENRSRLVYLISSHFDVWSQDNFFSCVSPHYSRLTWTV